MILGTAGHVDHGKTTLVRMLTGVDTDRLAEERRRGITIELGFAPLTLDDGTVVGVVDVPGHEAFVRTMVAGAAGVDLALLVVAADEGVMPQTREHLAILGLLGVRHGVVALTKRDLVDDDWIALVRDDVRAVLRSGPLADATIIETSAPDTGIVALRAEIARLTALVAVPRDGDDFRLPVDRAFSVRGTGTVVTGTVWSGIAHRDDAVRVLPRDVTVRVRAVHAHGHAVDATPARGRAALALVGVETADVARGATVVRGEGWRAARVLRADVALLAGVAVPGARARLRMHLGTAEVGVRVAGVWDEDRATPVRLLLDAPIVARAGDRFVLRGGPHLTTLGGGVVTDPHAEPRARRWSHVALTAAERLARLLDESRARGLAVASLGVRLGIAPADVPALLRSAGAPSVHGRAYAPAFLDDRRQRLLALVDAEHAARPLRPGAPVGTVRAALGLAPEVADHVLRAAAQAEEIVVHDGYAARAGWAPRLSGTVAATAAAVLAAVTAADAEPPTADHLLQHHPAATADLLHHLERRGDLCVVGDRYYAAPAVAVLLERLYDAMAPGVAYPPADLRDRLALPRRLAVPLLEHADRVGVTRRHDDGRVRVERGTTGRPSGTPLA